MRKDVFAGYHPAVNFFFRCAVIFLGLMIQHPVWVAVSFAAALSYAILLGGRKAIRFLQSATWPRCST